MKKTIRDQLLELPNGVGELAISYAEGNGTLDAPVFCSDPTRALNGAFTWEDTSEGFAYWYNIANGIDQELVNLETSSSAKLIFQNRKQADKFCKAWSKKTLKGHTVGSGSEQVEVSLYNVNDSEKAWINKYVSDINS